MHIYNQKWACCTITTNICSCEENVKECRLIGSEKYMNGGERLGKNSMRIYS